MHEHRSEKCEESLPMNDVNWNHRELVLNRHCELVGKKNVID
jgi:hypothetical protein